MKNIHTLPMLSLLFAFLSCAPSTSSPGDPIIAPGSGEDMREQGTFWVSRKKLWIPARFDEAISTALFYPSTSTGDLATGGPFPVVVIVQEQDISTDSFEWIASHLASWGFLVALPSHPLNRPSLAIDNAAWTLTGLINLGNETDSLFSGGIDGDQAGLIRLNIDETEAAWLDLADAFDTRTLLGGELKTANVAAIPGVALVIEGDKDCIADAALGWEDYTIERYLATVAGLSHGQFSNDLSADCQDSDCDFTQCSSDIELEEARALVGGSIAAFHRIFLKGEDLGNSLSGLLDEWANIDIKAESEIEVEDNASLPTTTEPGK